MGKERKHLKLFLSPIETKSENHKPSQIGILRKPNGANFNRTYEAVLWNRAEEFFIDLPRLENNLYIAYTPKINDFMNEKAIQLEIKDWKAAESVEPEVVERITSLQASLVAT
jgi:hypothetical protein